MAMFVNVTIPGCTYLGSWELCLWLWPYLCALIGRAMFVIMTIPGCPYPGSQVGYFPQVLPFSCTFTCSWNGGHLPYVCFFLWVP